MPIGTVDSGYSEYCGTLMPRLTKVISIRLSPPQCAAEVALRISVTKELDCKATNIHNRLRLVVCMSNKLNFKFWNMEKALPSSWTMEALGQGVNLTPLFRVGIKAHFLTLTPLFCATKHDGFKRKGSWVPSSKQYTH